MHEGSEGWSTWTRGFHSEGASDAAAGPLANAQGCEAGAWRHIRTCSDQAALKAAGDNDLLADVIPTVEILMYVRCTRWQPILG